MADILQITEDIPVDDSIYDYEYNMGNAEIDDTQPNYNNGYFIRHKYIIGDPIPNGTFSIKIPLKHFLGFCEDYKKILYGMQQRLTLTRTGDDNAIFRANALTPGKINIERIRWFMPHVIPSDAYRLQLDKIIEKKKKKYLLGIECYNVTVHRFQKIKKLLPGGLGLNLLQIFHVLL